MSRMMIISAAVAVIGLGAYFATSTGSSVTPSDPLGAANAQETGDVDTSLIQDMTAGNPDAPVTVIEYASFTCPHCAAFHAGPYKQLKSDYIDTGKIKRYGICKKKLEISFLGGPTTPTYSTNCSTKKT